MVNQYTDEYKKVVHTLRSKADYYCDTFKCTLTTRPKSKKLGNLCKEFIGCQGCNKYRLDLKKARVCPYLLSNYYIYLTHKLYRPTLIVDEAHQLIPMLQEFASKKLWQHKYKYPNWVTDRTSMLKWMNTIHPEFGAEDAAWQKFKTELTTRRPNFLLSRGLEYYRGKDKDCIKLVPLDIKEEPPFMWPSSVKKTVLMSATICRKDIEQLGMAGRQIAYISADSPIAAKQRPVRTPPSGGYNMAVRHIKNNLPHLIDYCQEISAKYPDSKGLVHATYSLANLIKSELPMSRYLYHDKFNKNQVYSNFKTTEDPKILVASGMYEGIDLPYDACRWQIIAKIPWPNLGDPALKYKADTDPEFYAWETIKTVLQACGRIVRTPTDFGETFIFDATFKRLYSEHTEFFPLWFQQSVTIL